MIPGGVNLAPNPSLTANLNGWGSASSGGTAGVFVAGRVTDWGWSGASSMYAKTTTSGGVFDRPAVYFYTMTTKGTYSIDIPAGTEYLSGSIRVKANIPGHAGGRFRLSWVYRNDANATVGSTASSGHIDFTNDTITTLTLEGEAVPVGATFIYVTVWMYPPAGTAALPANSVLWMNALQINPGLNVDMYLDGDQGPNYGWTGAVGASTSYRLPTEEQGPIGSGGVVTLSARVFKADRNNQLLEEVTDHILSGVVSRDIDRDGPKSTLQVAVDDPTLIPTHSWLAVFYLMERETTGLTTSQVGLFRVEQPTTVFSGGSVQTSYGGYDPAILLADAASSDTKKFTGRYINAIRGLCDELGISHAFVDDARNIPTAGISYPPGTSYLKMVNELLAAIGYYSVTANLQGLLTSYPIIEDLQSVEPSRNYTIGDNSELVGDMSFDPNDDTIFNHVVVYRDDPAKGTILKATRQFTDINSPISVPNLGLKSKVIALQDAADQAAIDARAAKEIQDRTMYVSGMLEIMPDPELDMHGVINLDLAGMAEVPGAEARSGRYYINSLSFPLGTSEGTMKLGIRRVERTDAA